MQNLKNILKITREIAVLYNLLEHPVILYIVDTTKWWILLLFSFSGEQIYIIVFFKPTMAANFWPLLKG